MMHKMTSGQALGFDMNDVGFCDDCGAEAFNVEPDARNYPCEECNHMMVFGAQELMLMGQAEITDLED